MLASPLPKFSELPTPPVADDLSLTAQFLATLPSKEEERFLSAVSDITQRTRLSSDVQRVRRASLEFAASDLAKDACEQAPEDLARTSLAGYLTQENAKADANISDSVPVVSSKVANDRQARQARLQELEAKAEAIMRKMGARGSPAASIAVTGHITVQPQEQSAPGGGQHLDALRQQALALLRAAQAQGAKSPAVMSEKVRQQEDAYAKTLEDAMNALRSQL